MPRRVAILFCLLALGLSAKPKLTALKFEVKSLDGKPVDRASVIVEFKEGRSVVKFGHNSELRWEVHTNQQGTVTIPPIPEGSIVVKVIAKPYQTFADTFEISGPEKTISITLNPPQQQYSVH